MGASFSLEWMNTSLSNKVSAKALALELSKRLDSADWPVMQLEGKQGRKQLLKHFIPVLVHDYSKQQWRNSSGHCCSLRLDKIKKCVLALQGKGIQEDTVTIPPCLPTVNFNMQSPTKPAWEVKGFLVTQTARKKRKCYCINSTKPRQKEIEKGTERVRDDFKELIYQDDKTLTTLNCTSSIVCCLLKTRPFAHICAFSGIVDPVRSCRCENNSLHCVARVIPST